MRSVADSNRCSWFCRPVTKPLIQPTILKWYHQESNRGHKDFQSFALPTELWHLAMGSWCDPLGARTQDPNIKSVVLYLLS